MKITMTTRTDVFLFILISSIITDLTGATRPHLRMSRQTQSCSQHSGEVLVTADGDPNSLDSSDISALENIYQQTLEEMVEGDSCFQVLDVTIDTDSISRRRLEAKNEDRQDRRRLSNTFSMVIWFQFQCHGCSGNLFGGNDASRRNLATTLVLRDDFISAYASKISQVSLLQNKVTGVEFLSELQAMEKCSAPDYAEQSPGLSIVFEGDYSPLKDGTGISQVSVIEEAIQEAYNSMNMPNPHSYDSHFRSLATVSYVFSSTQVNSFAMHFSVSYEYRNGPPSGIFDTLVDGSDYDRSELYVCHETIDIVTEECLYDMAAHYSRAPTEKEFISALELVLLRDDKVDSHFVSGVVALG